MNRSAKNLIKILQKNGFAFKRSKGTFFAIIKQAGIDKYYDN